MRRADIEVPNHAVDMNSWARSACYPRSTFYPLSDDRSTTSRRITSPNFRSCSSCCSRSQAPFCLYTLRAISIRTEGTFERLRYLLGGDRPSQTARLTMSPDLIQGRRLEFQHLKSGIPTVTPQKLTPLLLSLPPILYMKYRNPILSCSEAPWGLSV